MQIKRNVERERKRDGETGEKKRWKEGEKN